MKWTSYGGIRLGWFRRMKSCNSSSPLLQAQIQQKNRRSRSPWSFSLYGSHTWTAVRGTESSLIPGTNGLITVRHSTPGEGSRSRKLMQKPMWMTLNLTNRGTTTSSMSGVMATSSMRATVWPISPLCCRTQASRSITTFPCIRSKEWERACRAKYSEPSWDRLITSRPITWSDYWATSLQRPVPSICLSFSMRWCLWRIIECSPASRLCLQNAKKIIRWRVSTAWK